MAYTDYEFYSKSYLGTLLVKDDKADTFTKFAEDASDWLDTVTFKRLIGGLPVDPWSSKRVQKCVCKIADIMYELDQASKKADASLKGNLSGEADNTAGQIKSKSAGSESITYMTPAEIASGAKEWSTVYSAAADKEKTEQLLYKTAQEYLSGVEDDRGINLLYAGL